MTVTINGVSYSFATAPKFVRKAIALLVEQFGSTLNQRTSGVPMWAVKRAMLHAEKYGVVQ